MANQSLRHVAVYATNVLIEDSADLIVRDLAEMFDLSEEEQAEVVAYMMRAIVSIEEDTHE